MRFADDAFTTNFISTIGIDFKIKTVDIEGTRIKLQIWDTAGQERFRTITNAYYRGAMGILLVYDITDEISFRNVANWIRNIEQHAQDTVIRQLVGNKCDREEERVVTLSMGEELAKNHQMDFFECSAKKGQNITECFTHLAKEIKDQMMSIKPPGLPKPLDLTDQKPPHGTCCK